MPAWHQLVFECKGIEDVETEKNNNIVWTLLQGTHSNSSLTTRLISPIVIKSLNLLPIQLLCFTLSP